MKRSGSIRRPRGAALLVLAAVITLASLATPSNAGAKDDPLAGIPHNGWCRYYDKLPMDDMSEQQMMDEERFYPDMKHDLIRSNCVQLVPQLEAALKYAKQYPTAADAMRAGFRMIAKYEHGQGAHYIGPDGFSSTFNRRRPNFLLYGGNTPQAPLVGIMYLVSTGYLPPYLGMPGKNDHWHRHGDVCFVGGVIVADGISYAECAAMGGYTMNINYLWMLHAWIVPGYRYPPDIFRPHVPFLGMTAPDGSESM